MCRKCAKEQEVILIYISGPISNTDDYLYRFNKAEAQLEYDLFIPINPARILNELPVSYLEYKDLMRLCLDLLSMCDCIYMLTGWESSKGASLEYEFAITHNYKIFYQE